jgi:hypothetical protein
MNGLASVMTPTTSVSSMMRLAIMVSILIVSKNNDTHVLTDRQYDLGEHPFDEYGGLRYG